MEMRSQNTMSSNACQDLRDAPFKILHYHSIEAELNFGSLSIEHLKKSNRRQSVKVRIENVALSEINAELWDRALLTAIGDISNNSYPHVSIVKKLINYTLNTQFMDTGMTTCFYVKLFLFHPPRTSDMQNYYFSILSDRYLMLDPSQVEEKNVFWCLIDVLIVCLENEEFLKGFMNISCQKEFYSKKGETTEDMINLNRRIAGDEKNWIESPKKETMCIKHLSPAEQVQRVLIVLEFLYNIIEDDFIYKMKGNNSTLPFLANLIWDKVEDVGLVNDRVKKFVNFWFLLEKVNVCHFFPLHVRKMFDLLTLTTRWLFIFETIALRLLRPVVFQLVFVRSANFEALGMYIDSG